jgi:tight adherence protein C
VVVAKAGLSGRVTPEQILGAKMLLPLAMAAFLGLQVAGGGDDRLILLLASGTMVAFFVPDLLLRAAADRRAELITDALPDLLDQVTIAVEAGLDFESALSRSTSGQDHPLAIEFLRTLQDVRLGASRADALTALAERSQVDDLKSVVLSLRQADSLGVPLAKTLRTLSNEMREKRRYRAEEKAQRLPTLMIFPLGLCILPALFIVILGPVLVTGFTP